MVNLEQPLDGLTPGEIQALKDYKSAASTPSGLSHCFDLNCELDRALLLDEITSDLMGTAKHLDAVLERCPYLRPGTTVFRADGHRLRFRDIQNVGTRFRNLGFWSTSTVRESTFNFLKPVTDRGYGVIFELHLSEYQRGFDMEALKEFGGAESELLLPRGILWRVKEVKGSARDIDQLTASKFENIFDIVLEAVGPSKPIA